MNRLGFTAILLAALLLLGFQNCLRIGAPANSTTSQSTTPANNGNGYDGKIYVHLIADGSLCPDGSRIDSKINYDGTMAYLVRDACQDLPQGQAIAVTPSSTNARVVAYAGVEYYLLVWEIYDLAKDSAGNSYVAGGGWSETLRDRVPFIAKVDGNRNVLWAKRLPGFKAGYNSSITTARPSPDGGIVCFGFYHRTGPYNKSAMVMKLSADGNLLWAKNFLTADPINTYPSFIGELDDAGNIYVGGQVTYLSNNYFADVRLPDNNHGDSFVAMLDANGVPQWQTVYQTPAHFAVGYFAQLRVSSAREVFIAANFNPYFGGLIKLDGAGRQVWSRAIGDRLIRVTLDGAGGAVAGGDQILSRFGTDGTLQWSTQIDFAGENTRALTGITRMSDGRFLITGQTAVPSDQNSYALVVRDTGALDSANFIRGLLTNPYATPGPIELQPGRFLTGITKADYEDELLFFDLAGDRLNCSTCAPATGLTYAPSGRAAADNPLQPTPGATVIDHVEDAGFTLEPFGLPLPFTNEPHP